MKLTKSIAFRVDASLKIGTGHVMRCLTLAQALRQSGAEIRFISRELSGHIIDHIEKLGFTVQRLSPPCGENFQTASRHADWAEVSLEQDAKETLSALKKNTVDWLVVDHYSLDKKWELAISVNNMRIMVIDDLADRPHYCELLLDQNLGRKLSDYETLVPKKCKLLIGSSYALLRPEFSRWRKESLERRRSPKLQNIFVFMGGIDQHNFTAPVLRALQKLNPCDEYYITVILGKNSPWTQEIRTLIKESKVPIELLQGVDDMARLMTRADLAILAAGSTVWEACCLGLPMMTIQTAKNQEMAIDSLSKLSAATTIDTRDLENSIFNTIFDLTKNPEKLYRASLVAQRIITGDGVKDITTALGKEYENEPQTS